MKKKNTKQKKETISKQIAHLVAATNRLVDEMRNEHRKNIKELRKKLEKIEEQITPKDIASPKDKFIRYK